MSSMRNKAIRAIETRGCLLVYPLKNRSEPSSLWSELFPRSQMVWEWNEDSDRRINDLWILREELSRSRMVVYAKWFQGRATFFSFDFFRNFLAALDAHRIAEEFGPLSADSRNVLDVLLSDSPLSTKQLKAAVELEGRLNESAYNRATKALWNRLLLVGFGEFDDSSFPSLGMGATATLFEDLWNESKEINRETAQRFLAERLGEENPFYKFARKLWSAELRLPSS